MIRPTRPDDHDRLRDIATATGVFRPIELDCLTDVIDDYFKEGEHNGHRALTFELEGKPVGFTYYAPTPMTFFSWHMYWIFVDKTIQAKGIGAQLLHHAEKDIAQAGGRVLFIETSMLPIYDLTRKFYLKYGYDQEAILRDFYTEGDDQVIFRKRLAFA